jgi:glycerol-3-phosphate O-acyltransferase
MTGHVTISLWLLLLLIGFSIWAVLDRILIPSTRWFLRRRINRVIDEISTRLHIEIRPFQLTKRQVLIDRLIYDPKVIEAIQHHALEYDMPREVVQKQAAIYAREIVPSFNAYLYFRIGYWMAKKIARLLYRVRVGVIDDAKLGAVDPESTVVFVMNHRSNMDYILVAFLAAERTTLSYAVGEWARVWPLQTLIRAMGAFFVRRSSGDPLYRRVLERYVHMATKEGVCQAVFLEGGLSRDGRMREPKLGFVDYMLRGFDASRDRDIVFVPVGINYDRTLEDRSLQRYMDPEAKKRSWWFIFRTTFRFVRRSLFLMVCSRWKRYGYAAVNFGTPISAKDFASDRGINFRWLERTQRFPEIERLCRRLTSEIQRSVPVLPVTLVSTLFLEAGNDGMDIGEIEHRADDLMARLQACGGPVIQLTRGTKAHVIAGALEILKLRRAVVESDGRYTVVDDERELLRYYANAIAHWFDMEPSSGN